MSYDHDVAIVLDIEGILQKHLPYIHKVMHDYRFRITSKAIEYVWNYLVNESLTVLSRVDGLPTMFIHNVKISEAGRVISDELLPYILNDIHTVVYSAGVSPRQCGDIETIVTPTLLVIVKLRGTYDELC